MVSFSEKKAVMKLFRSMANQNPSQKTFSNQWRKLFWSIKARRSSESIMKMKIYCDDHSSLSSPTAVQYEFHTYFTSFHCTGRYELNKLTSLPMRGLAAQLVEHCTGIAEVTSSNPVEALIFFRLLPSNCLNWKIYCDDHSSLSSTTPVRYEFQIYFKCCLLG